MSNFESYPDTSSADMDPVLRSKIIAFAEDGHSIDRLIEVFGSENVRLAAVNNSHFLELIDPVVEEGSDAS